MVEKLLLGISYPLQITRHLKDDFEDIKNSGVNSILLAVSEDSLAYNFEGVKHAIKLAKEFFDYVSLNFWAMGGIFGGEASSYFLQRYSGEAQKFNISKGAEGAVCPQSKIFKKYFFDLIKRIIEETEVDEIFIDEPHWPTFRGKMRKIDDSIFSCICEKCRKRFFEENGFNIPLNEAEKGWSEFVLYRKKIMMEFLKDIVKNIKSCARDVNVNLCIHPKDNWVYGSPKLEDVIAIKGVDIISIDPYHFKFKREEGKKYVLSQVRNILNVATKERKDVQVWIQGFKVPSGRESEVGEIVEMIHNEGVCNIQFWSYGNEAFSLIVSDDFKKVWDSLKRSYLKLKG